MHFLEAQNISYKINDRNILSSITFNIGFGELVKISGRNGSGKTTLLKIIVGLTKQTKGSLTRKSEEKICFIGHKSGLKNYLTVRENLLVHGLKINSLNLGLLEKFSFKEISKRLYSRLDPQKPLPPLIIKSKKVQVS